MNPLDAVSLESLRTRTSIKWRFFEPDVLPLWVAEMDVIPAEAVQEAMAKAMSRGDTGYAFGPAYAEAVARFSIDRWGFEPDVTRSMTVSDVMMGIFELLRLVTGPGDSVIIPSPVYPPFHAYTVHAERTPVPVPLTADFRLDIPAIAAACATATSNGSRAAVLIANPHNPTGTVHTHAELAALAEVAARTGATVISDEIHAPLTYRGSTFTPYVSVDPRGYAVFSASKSWNLAGIRSAVIFGGSETSGVASMPEVVTHGPAHLAVLTHVAALDHARDWLDELLAGLDHNRQLLTAALASQAAHIGYREPDATFLAWLDLSATAIADPHSVADPGFVGLAAGPSVALRDRARVGVNAGEAFGIGGENRIRLNFGTRSDVLLEAINRIAAVV